jgi:hypothetical protein
VELGNSLLRATIVDTYGNSCTVVHESEVGNPFFHNGLIKNQKHFVESLKELMHFVSGYRWSNTTVGIDCSQIVYSCFRLDTHTNLDASLLHYKSMHYPNHKLLETVINGQDIASLSIPSAMLDKIYEAFNSIGINVNRFVPLRYIEAADLMRRGSFEKCMVLNIGYCASNICVFNSGFLTSYKTVRNGIEQVVSELVVEYNVTPEEAVSMILNTPLFPADTREWNMYNGRHFRMDRLSESVRSNLTKLLFKILNRDSYDANHLILTGWADKIHRINELVSMKLDKLEIINILRQNVLESSLKARVRY